MVTIVNDNISDTKTIHEQENIVKTTEKDEPIPDVWRKIVKTHARKNVRREVFEVQSKRRPAFYCPIWGCLGKFNVAWPSELLKLQHQEMVAWSYHILPQVSTNWALVLMPNQGSKSTKLRSVWPDLDTNTKTRAGLLLNLFGENFLNMKAASASASVCHAFIAVTFLILARVKCTWLLALWVPQTSCAGEGRRRWPTRV